ncbi:MAG: 4Fe-4S dicluster domain-containing protein [Gemmatimonadetes bacterium]|nr:4Fe-4S dicluster domain-containing protein [Gemmatimonadota bacterium]
MKRRDFLKVLGVSGAGVAAAGCSTSEVQKLIPYVVPSEDIVPGVPTWYSSTCRECPSGCGVHVETHEGRVTKLEGNPVHPVSRGNLCAIGQASVQGLYHPDRYQGPAVVEAGIGSRNLTWDAAEGILAERIQRARQAGRAGGIVLLTGNYTGTMARLADDFVRSLGGRRVVYEPLANQPRGLNFADTDLLVAFGADFLETWGSPLDYQWQFKQMHAYRNGRRGKFVWVGPHRPLTGLNADQWIAPKPGTEALIALALSNPGEIARAAQITGVEEATLRRLSDEWTRATKKYALGPGLAVTGRNVSDLRGAVARLNGGAPAMPANPTRMQDIVALIDQMKRGEIEVLMVDAPNPAYSLPKALGFEAAYKRVPTRVSFSTFPDETSMLATLVLPNHHYLEAWDDDVPQAGVYNLVQPAMRPVFNTKQVGDVLLSVARRLNLPAVAGAGNAGTYYDYLRQGWAAIAPGVEGWRAAVKRGGVFPAPRPGEVAMADGFLGVMNAGAAGAAAAPAPGTATALPAAPATATAAPVAAAPVAPAAAVAPQYQPLQFEGAADAKFHLVVYPSLKYLDGRTANRPWLLELPDPVTKVSWSSWVEIHPRTAKELGVEQGDILKVHSPYGSVEAPAYVYPGVRPDTVAIQMGLGHKAFGRFTEGRGVNPIDLLGPSVDPTTGEFAPYGMRVSVSKSAGKPGFPEGLFEYGNRLQADREVAQAISFASITQRDRQGKGLIPGQEEHTTPIKDMGGFAPAPTTTDPAQYPPPGTRYGQYIEGETRWAMAIDLSRCTGCSACVVACYAENNIPVVGPTEIKKGRILNWLRIERYFGETRDKDEALRDDATDDVRFLPMMCQQCGNAPCEPVCPVYAAYHTPDGLNGQVYNRCVGTRYCQNNCPYKVRYFNWFTYQFAEPLNWQLNPDVTVREKGVMEKCTFCVQRIHEVERNAATERRPVRDGEVVPACVQTCPTEVFVFGNIQDPNSLVARAAASNRSYRVLEELNTQSAIVYLKKVTLAEPERTGNEVPAGAGYNPTGTQETQ